ncbi:MAG: 4Fe-4S ferredoxin, partial [Candidatus Thorarchaeota archaeon]|nr:4Fe-4S ferredoxin [Candidatus Thorarchaeota archaeon]
MKVTAISRVFFSDRNTSAQYNMLDKVEHVLTQLGLDTDIKDKEKVMIKTHMGLWGNTNHIRPA